MKHSLKNFWYRFGGWFLLLGVPLVVVVMGLTARQGPTAIMPLSPAPRRLRLRRVRLPLTWR